MGDDFEDPAGASPGAFEGEEDGTDGVGVGRSWYRAAMVLAGAAVGLPTPAPTPFDGELRTYDEERPAPPETPGLPMVSLPGFSGPEVADETASAAAAVARAGEPGAAALPDTGSPPPVRGNTPPGRGFDTPVPVPAPASAVATAAAAAEPDPTATARFVTVFFGGDADLFIVAGIGALVGAAV